MKKLTLILSSVFAIIGQTSYGQSIDQTKNALTFISLKEFMASRDTVTMRQYKTYFSPEDMSLDWKDIYFDTIRVSNCAQHSVDLNGLILGNKYTKIDVEAKFGTPSLFLRNYDGKKVGEEYYCYFEKDEKSIGEYDTDKIGIILYFVYGRFVSFNINQISDCGIYNNGVKVGDNLNDVIKSFQGGITLKRGAYRFDRGDVAIVCDYINSIIANVYGVITDLKIKPKQ